jgi:hypothetical protein
MFIEFLDELIVLLNKVDPSPSEWVRWSEKSKELYLSGMHEDSYKKILGASGGMGSFDDDYWSYSLSEQEQQRHDFLKYELRKLAKISLENA